MQDLAEYTPVRDTSNAERLISLGPGLAAIPEKLLLAHARGEVLFIAGAGVSRPAGLPDFRCLVLKVYKQLDSSVHAVMSRIPPNAQTEDEIDFSGLTNQQAAEVKRFFKRDYDVVLGMLERRMEGRSDGQSSVRKAVASILRKPGVKPAPIHRALMRLSDRGGVGTILTTNFGNFLAE